MKDEEIINKYKSLSDKNKSLLFSGKIAEDLSSIGEANKIEGEELSKIAEEVISIILGIKNKESLKESLKQTGIEPSSIETIVEQINNKILNQVEKENVAVQNEEKPKERQSNVGESFEETILNQAIAMQAIAPDNLPTEESGVQSQSVTATPKYTGNDPYREAV